MKKRSVAVLAVLGLSIAIQAKTSQAEVQCRTVCSEQGEKRVAYCQQQCADEDITISTGTLAPSAGPRVGAAAVPATSGASSSQLRKANAMIADRASLIGNALANTASGNLSGMFDGGAVAAASAPSPVIVQVPGLINIGRPEPSNRSLALSGRVTEASYCVRSHTEQVCNNRTVCSMVCAGVAGGIGAGGGRVGGAIGGAVGCVMERVCEEIPDCRTVTVCDYYGGSGSEDGK